MAKRTVVTETLTDDLDGTKADQTVRFAWEGAEYEMELSKKNHSALEKALRPYVSAARRVPKKRLTGVAVASSMDKAAHKQYLGQVREWATANGMQVSARGKVAQAIIDAYEAAH